MNTSGNIKRGLAVSAISAMAIAGLPQLAPPASASPIVNDYPSNGAITASDIELLNPDSSSAQVTTTAYNLVAAASADVTQIVFQFAPITTPGVYSNIGGPVDRVDGAFTRVWTPTVNGNLRVVPLNAAGDLVEPEATAPVPVVVNVPGSSDTAKIGGDTNLGVWNSKATAGGANSYTVGVTGSTSLTDTASGLDDGYRVVVDARTGATGTANGDVTGATAGAFSAVLPLTGYAFTPGGPDQIVIGAEPQDAVGGVDGAKVNIEDAATKTLYLQQLATVTAVAANPNLQPGQTTQVTGTVVDQNGKPIAGATVYRSVNGAAATPVGGPGGVTNAAGQYTDTGGAGLTSGSYKYFVNAPAGAIDNPQGTEEPALGDKSATVAIAVYTPVLTAVNVQSTYGTASDLDEVDPGRPYVATAVDQNGNGLNGESLAYTWTVDPFDPALPTLTSNAITDAGLTAGGTPATRGQTSLRFANLSDFTPALSALPSGTWTLRVSRQAVGGIGAFNAAPVDYKVGQGKVAWTPTDAQAVIGGTTTLKGTFSLEDGTALGSIDRTDTDPLGDVDRTAALSYAAGLEDDPATPAVETAAGDSRIAPKLEQDATVTAVPVNGLSATVKFGADGVANVKVADATPETFEEIDATVTASPTGLAAPAPTTTDDTVATIDFLTSVAAQTLTVDDDNDQLDPAFGPTPGRPVRIEFKVVNASGKVLSNKDVAIDVAGGAFITDALPATLAAATTAQLNGIWANNGTTATVKTNASGIASVVVAIEKNAGFDDDFRHNVTVTATADGKSVQSVVGFRAQDAVDLDRVEITPNVEDAAGLPDRQVGIESVRYDVVAYDQFGNRSDENYTANDDGNPRADITSSGDTQNTLDSSDLVATATSATNQVVMVNIVDLNGAAASSNATDTADAIAWYVVDYNAATYTLGQTGDETVDTGDRVTEVLTATDQKGRPIQGLNVKFIRSGPTDNDSDQNGSDTTNSDGKAFYDFVGGSAGTARISAIVSRFGSTNRAGTAEDTVVFVGGTIDPDPDPVRTAIKVKVTGKSVGNKDVLTVRTAAKAAGAQVIVFRKVGNRNVRVGVGSINGQGLFVVKTKDLNKNAKTVYFAKVKRTVDTKFGQSPNKGVR